MAPDMKRSKMKKILSFGIKSGVKENLSSNFEGQDPEIN